MTTAGKKAATTRKRRGAAKKAVATKRRKAAAKKAAATKRRSKAAVKANATKRRKRAAKKAAASRAANATTEPDRGPTSFRSYPATFEWRRGARSIRAARGAEGGEVFTATIRGRPVLVIDESTMADLAPEVADECISIYRFSDLSQRAKFMRASLR